MQAQPDQDTLHETLARWDFELGLARRFISHDPLTALSWTLRIDGEIAGELQRRADAEELLTPLRDETHALIDQSRTASRRFLDESARRERDFEAREQQQLATPMAHIRRPHN